MDAANSDDFSEHLEELKRSYFGNDIHCDRLGHQLRLVHAAVRTALPEVRQVTLPPTTQELPRNRHKAGSTEQLPAYAMSQIDYGHTGQC